MIFSDWVMRLMSVRMKKSARTMNAAVANDARMGVRGSSGKIVVATDRGCHFDEPITRA